MDKLILTIWLILSVCSAWADEDDGGMFRQGRKQFSLTSSNGHAFNSNYFVIGVSVGYFVEDGLGLGFSYENWSGGNRSITKFSPYAQYVFTDVSSFQPYVGGFYRHTAVSGLPDINSVGGRVGFYFSSGQNASVSVGMVYESYLNCQESLYSSCRQSYPDVGVTLGF